MKELILIKPDFQRWFKLNHPQHIISFVIWQLIDLKTFHGMMRCILAGTDVFDDSNLLSKASKLDLAIKISQSSYNILAALPCWFHFCQDCSFSILVVGLDHKK
jgi:hypothetical protein